MANSLKITNLTPSGDHFSLRFKLVGNWKQTMQVIESLAPSMKASSIIAQMKLGNDLVKRVKGHIRKQDLPWADLHAATIAKKKRSGGGGRILINKGVYLKSINVWKIGSQKLVMIGVRRGIYSQNYNNRKGRIDVATAAAVHEFSSGRRVPRRPLWNPTIKEMGGAAGFRKRYVTDLKADLKKRGIPIHNI